MYLQDTLKQVETLKDSARAQEEESRSTRLNLEDKTKENKEKVLSSLLYLLYRINVFCTILSKHFISI